MSISCSHPPNMMPVPFLQMCTRANSCSDVTFVSLIGCLQFGIKEPFMKFPELEVLLTNASLLLKVSNAIIQLLQFLRVVGSKPDKQIFLIKLNLIFNSTRSIRKWSWSISYPVNLDRISNCQKNSSAIKFSQQSFANLFCVIFYY